MIAVDLVVTGSGAVEDLVVDQVHDHLRRAVDVSRSRALLSGVLVFPVDDARRIAIDPESFRRRRARRRRTRSRQSAREERRRESVHCRAVTASALWGGEVELVPKVRGSGPERFAEDRARVRRGLLVGVGVEVASSREVQLRVRGPVSPVFASALALARVSEGSERETKGDARGPS